MGQGTSVLLKGVNHERYDQESLHNDPLSGI